MAEMRKALRYFAITGNVLFALWMLFNGIDEGFKATPLQLVSYIGLWALLALNTLLIYRQK